MGMTPARFLKALEKEDRVEYNPETDIIYSNTSALYIKQTPSLKKTSECIKGLGPARAYMLWEQYEDFKAIRINWMEDAGGDILELAVIPKDENAPGVTNETIGIPGGNGQIKKMKRLMIKTIINSSEDIDGLLRRVA